MRVIDYSFELPKHLIAQYPPRKRSYCRLLSLDGPSGKLSHNMFTDVLHKLNSGDLLVLNNTRVIPARIYGRKPSGGKVEILIERMLDDSRVLAHVRSSKVLQAGTKLLLGDDKNEKKVKSTIITSYNNLFEIIFEDDRTLLNILDSIGHIPLPPYIRRLEEKIDYKLYQTVYGTHLGSIAAPTAGLHFDRWLLDALKAKGVNIVFITLHIGAGTFYPVRVQTIEEHIMHSEYAEVSQEVVDAIISCKERGNKVVAVGTTSVRSLESAANACKNTLIAPFFDNTQIFIYLGYKYRIVDALITNFHLPKSTLLMLVSAFAGYKHTMEAYHSAILEQYRFFSYGDAMYITHNPKASN
ncbi:tRNA preQ1(34) S-adenosylmethionine ribosyltransferase-isomerase QueA [Pantoea sp. Aalb]|uniref:tRNA preQ1(34) S-adenosylmethionine ribosyltransferase-isomerase QueA n=1 Tax=Pantoea sp. Aalb TaxID=2576762 RepID=UPI00132B2DAB|nr:tRNA preQ1(34) S-adenosylmethionine ribosyltransferase-isomerase QueA [Pantoea sp. Aalb]MXP67593.1 tRNA preQ1(34) S-adenosylmethionine ribosyltransferase-isomerase QueA [Pantoea sp. Aalb]